jgi:hypothetical protein
MIELHSHESGGGGDYYYHHALRRRCFDNVQYYVVRRIMGAALHMTLFQSHLVEVGNIVNSYCSWRLIQSTVACLVSFHQCPARVHRLWDARRLVTCCADTDSCAVMQCHCVRQVVTETCQCTVSVNGDLIRADWCWQCLLEVSTAFGKLVGSSDLGLRWCAVTRYAFLRCFVPCLVSGTL